MSRTPRSLTLAAILTSALAPGCDALDGSGTSTRSTPCAQTRALHFAGERGWLGCSGSVGGGIWRTLDSGRTWTHAADSEGGPSSLRGQSARFNDIEVDAGGSVYFCGGDNDTSPKVFLYRLFAAGAWETLMTRETLLEGGGRGYSDCQNVAVEGDLVVTDDNAGAQIAWSYDAGESWSKAEIGQISELAVADGLVFGSGGTTGAGPMFYADSRDPATLLAGAPITESEGGLQEARGMATPDGGETWIMAGARDGAGGAWIWRSADAGQTWADVGVEGADVAFFEDVACVRDWCIAAGRSHPGDEGLAYESADAGRTWTRRPLAAGLSPFYIAFADPGADAIWLAGDGPDLLRLATPRAGD